MATALERAEAEIAAMSRFHAENRAAMVELGAECRQIDDASAARARYLAGQVLMYLSMRKKALKSVIAYRVATGKVPYPVKADASYYRRCALSLMRELRALAPAAAPLLLAAE